MKHYLTFGEKPITDFNAVISGAGTFGAPERDRKTVTIPGRNGELTIDNGRYKNIKVTYPAFIAKDYDQNVEALRNYLLSIPGYARLEDTYHPDEFRKGRYSGAFDGGATKGMHAGSFKLEFDCMPQRWLKSGENPAVSWTAPPDGLVGGLLNPTLMEALPLLRVELSNASYALITIDGVTIKCTNATGAMYVDCELQEAYKESDGSNMNQYLELVDGAFPSFKAGTSEIFIRCNSSSGGVLGSLTVDITPRWWRL